MNILKLMKRSHWLLLAAMTAFISMQAWLDLEIPGYMSQITVLLSKGSSEGAILDVGTEMILCSLGSVVCSLIAGGIAAYVAAQFANILRRKQFERVQSFNAQEMSRFNTYSLITRSTNDITQVQLAIARTSQLVVKVPVMCYIALSKIATGSWEWTEVTAVGIVLIVIMQVFMLSYVIPCYKKVQRFTDGMNRTVREGMTGVRVIRAFNAEEFQNAKSDASNGELTENNLKASRLTAFTRPFNGVIQNILTVAIYILGAGIILDQADPDEGMFVFSNMIVFSSYVLYVVSSFILLAHVAMGLPRAIVSAHRISEVINTEASIVNGTVKDVGKDDTCISFRNVSFAYPNASGETISDVSFDIRKGETVAIVGPTGSGKSTLVNLIPRLFDTTGGTVSVGGHDVREYDMSALHSKIGFATQKATIFSGTAAFNIGYGNDDATREDMMSAARIAHIDAYLDSHEGLDTVFQQKGANLSGGQKQRISIARAVCRKPDIFIFDDTFSALDFLTDVAVRRDLRRATGDATVIITSQRISTIRDSDSIIVIDGGRLVGKGTHGDLMRDCPTYRMLAEAQGVTS